MSKTAQEIRARQHEEILEHLREQAERSQPDRETGAPESVTGNAFTENAFTENAFPAMVTSCSSRGRA
jgi:hypothetical protein